MQIDLKYNIIVIILYYHFNIVMALNKTLSATVDDDSRSTTTRGRCRYSEAMFSFFKINTRRSCENNNTRVSCAQPAHW